ncbi:MAG: hypothetical protein J6Z11_04585, partial [Candidatus Riflebacteria bacterium]|nr:hypothetical protein [Candidatus Riflebacteria bacterium]
MRKNIFLVIATIIILFLIYEQNDTWRHISPDTIFTAIISTDGCISPGEKQDFLVSLFKNVDGKRLFESKTDIGIKLSMPLQDGTIREAIIPLSNNAPGKYLCSFTFPENLDDSEIEVCLFPDNRTDKPISKCKIPVKRERAIVIKPPENQVYIGSKVSFKLASVDIKSGQPLFKIPIRVKLIPPSGFTTINRVVTTDFDGLATFQTKIHPASPEGVYTFIFQSGNFHQKVYVNVKKANNNSSLTENLDSIPFYTQTDNSNENSGYIFNLNCEKDGILIAYGCPESEHRQIEIWQNGKLHYYSNFPLEGGIVSIPLNKPLLAGCPALFKVWQIKDNQVSSHEKIRYISPNNPNKLGNFLMDVNSEFQNTEKDRLACSFSRKGFIAASSKLSVENLTKTNLFDLKEITPSNQSEIPISYYENLLNKTDNGSSSFLLVDRKYELAGEKDYHIILDTKLFLDEYINYLSKREPSLNSLLQESLCRIDRYQLLDLQSQKTEIENIEALITPISEIYSYLNKFQNQKKIFAPSILSCINRVKNVTFIPAEFSFDFSQNQYDLSYLPMLDIEPVARGLQSIQGVFKTTGKVFLRKSNTTSVIDLNKPIITISSKEWESIENLRSIP